VAGWGTCKHCRQRIWWGANPNGSGKAFPFDDQDEQQVHFNTCSATQWVQVNGQRQRVSACRSCGAKVWWETTPNGKRRPMNVISSPIFGDDASLECHFDTCTAGVASAAPGARHEWNPTPNALPSREPDISVWLGVLGLTYPSSLEQVTRAFRALAMRTHPDMGGTTADFVRVKLAFDRCKDLLGAAA